MPLAASETTRTPSEEVYINVAVREGFEPSIRFRIHTFQACSFNHSDTSPIFFNSCFYSSRAL